MSSYAEPNEDADLILQYRKGKRSFNHRHYLNLVSHLMNKMKEQNSIDQPVIEN